MSALKRRVVDLEDGRYWAVYGLRGVVEFNIQDFAEYGTRDAIARSAVGMHSPVPLPYAQTSRAGCPFLEGACFIEMSDAGGELIADLWEEAAFDDAVIWRWLEDYYAEFTGGRS